MSNLKGDGPAIAKLVTKYNKKELAGLILKGDEEYAEVVESLRASEALRITELEKQSKKHIDFISTKDVQIVKVERELSKANDENAKLIKEVTTLQTKLERIQDVIKMYYAIKHPEYLVDTGYDYHPSQFNVSSEKKPEELLMLDHIVAIAEGKL